MTNPRRNRRFRSRRLRIAAPGAANASGAPPGIARGQLRERAMNRNETDYAGELERARARGEIQWWAFEALKLRLADNTYLTPDFVVLGVGSELELHEVKGAKRKRTATGPVVTYFCEEDAKVKLKAAAEHFPFLFRVVFKSGNGLWLKETI